MRPVGLSLVAACAACLVTISATAARGEHNYRPYYLKGHEASVLAVGFSHDGKTLVSAGGDGRVVIWDIENWKVKRVIQRHPSAVTAVAISPNGARVATGGLDRRVRLFNATNGELLAVGEGQRGRVYSLAFSPDSKVLAAGGGVYASPGNVLLWGVADGDYEKRDRDREAENRRAAAANDENNDRPRDPEADIPRLSANSELADHALTVHSVMWSHDGGLLASGGGRNAKPGEVRLYDPGKPELKSGNDESPPEVRALAFTHDNAMLAAAGRSRDIRLWSTADGKPAGGMRGASGAIIAMAFTPDNDHLHTVALNGVIQRWSVKAGQPFARRPGPRFGTPGAAAFSRDGKWLAGGTRKGLILLWEMAKVETPEDESLLPGRRIDDVRLRTPGEE